MTELHRPIVWPDIPCDGATQGAVGWPTLYQDLARMRRDAWRNLCHRYEENPADFYTAWHWLQGHPIFWYFGYRAHESNLCHERGVDEGLEFHPAKVNPNTLSVSKRSSKNTLLQIWVEVFPTSLKQGSNNSVRLHDVDCDTGAGTYEEAVIAVAKLIYAHHGNDRVMLEQKWSSA